MNRKSMYIIKWLNKLSVEFLIIKKNIQFFLLFNKKKQTKQLRYNQGNDTYQESPARLLLPESDIIFIIK